MRYRTLGRTGLLVSEIGFGCGSIGGLLVRGDPAEQARAVGRAQELGITYFDTAPSYGDGHSEENLGQVLRELKAQVTLGTKFRLLPEEVEHAEAAIRSSLETSLQRLGRDSVDLLQLHNNVTLERGVRPGSLGLQDVLGPIVDGLRALQREGLARFIGFTGLGDTKAMAQVVASGAFDTVQCYFNLLNPSAGYSVGRDFPAQDLGRIIDRAAEGGMGVLAIRVLAAGALGGDTERHPVAGNPGTMPWAGSDYQTDLLRAQSLRVLVHELEMESPAELAMRFALAKAGVSSVMIGFSDVGQVEAAVRYAERGALDQDRVLRVISVVAGQG